MYTDSSINCNSVYNIPPLKIPDQRDALSASFHLSKITGGVVHYIIRDKHLTTRCVHDSDNLRRTGALDSFTGGVPIFHLWL